VWPRVEGLWDDSTGFLCGRRKMSGFKMVGIVLIAAGILGLAYRGFSYTKETHEAKIGSLELSVNEKQTVSIPVWIGVGALVAGGFLVLLPKQQLVPKQS